MKKAFLLVLLPLFCWGQASFYLDDTVKLNYTHSILVEDLKKHLQVLASDSLEGRETGEKGQKIAAEYIANCFKKLEYHISVKHIIKNLKLNQKDIFVKE